LASNFVDRDIEKLKPASKTAASARAASTSPVENAPPTDGDWMSAYEAIQFLRPYGVGERAICSRTHAGLIKARARLFISSGMEQTEVEVPREFWATKRGAVLRANWAAGDFEKVVYKKMGSVRTESRQQTFGVTFRRADIEQLKPATAAKATPSPAPAQRRVERTTVFIGHGHSEEWRKLAMFLQNDHDLKVIEFNSSSPAGISTTDHLQQMLVQANFAFLILTGEDEQATGGFKPRLNVVHEAGLFQGKLGFRKAILFLEDGCQDFSNVSGLTHIPFPRGKIEAQFHEATRVLRREELIP
jgi:predicted nucleotide-binding protein